MVKFGEVIDSQRRMEFESAYIDYDKLKNVIKKVKRDVNTEIEENR